MALNDLPNAAEKQGNMVPYDIHGEGDNYPPVATHHSFSVELYMTWKG